MQNSKESPNLVSTVCAGIAFDHDATRLDLGTNSTPTAKSLQLWWKLKLSRKIQTFFLHFEMELNSDFFILF